MYIQVHVLNLQTIVSSHQQIYPMVDVSFVGHLKDSSNHLILTW